MDYLAFGLFALGVIFIVLEFFLPGAVAGIVGVICLAAGIYVMVDDLDKAVFYIAILIIVALLALPLWLKFLKQNKHMKKLWRPENLTSQAGYLPAKEDLHQYVGQEGRALTLLRPSGTMELPDGRRLDVVTQGDYIEAGTPVKIIRTEGTWLVVARIS